jgi:hypothetical protein
LLISSCVHTIVEWFLVESHEPYTLIQHMWHVIYTNHASMFLVKSQFCCT